MELHNNLKEILLLLMAAVFIVAIFKRLRLSPVLGYLVAGMAIGPFGLEQVNEIRTTGGVAEFGVVFLLFYIGLELTFDRLRTMYQLVFGFGGCQVIITGTIFTLAGIYIFKLSPQAAIIVGGGLALSSTAIVLQVMAERGNATSQLGRLTLSVLIAQDLAVVPLLVLVSILSKGNTNLAEALLIATVKALAALVMIFLFGRILLRPLFRLIGMLKSEELFAATTLIIVLGAAWATERAGLSLALGAFVAGLMVAETEFRHQVTANIMPFKGLLLGLFFMTVGMSINMEFLIANLAVVILLSAAIIAIKSGIIIGLCQVAKMPKSRGVQAGLLLAQGGEFAFVLFGIALHTGLLPRDVSQILLVVVSLTMALTPLLAMAGRKIAGKIDKGKQAHMEHISQEAADLKNHVIIAGFGRMGQTIGRLLALEDIQYIALDTDPKRIYKARLQGFPVFYGDASRLEVLNSLGIAKASAVIVTTNNIRSSKAAVETVHDNFPQLPLYARAKDLDDVKNLEESGATLVVPETLETSLRLGAAALYHFGIAEHEVERVIRLFRTQDYMAAKGAEEAVG